jgi:hypothetical protein
MKELYTKPEVDLEEFEAVDVLTASPVNGNIDTDVDNGDGF